MNDFCYKLASRNEKLAQEGKVQRFFIRTYGCQMNERDSEKMAGLLGQMGFEKAASQDGADLILYNTCCVRESAEDKIFGNLSYLKPLKEKKPQLIVGVGGCMSQQENIFQKLFDKYKYVDLIFGTGNRHRLPEFLWRIYGKNERIADISESEDLPEITGISVTTREFSFKAGVNIMYGCDNFCSYCIVPYVRGREKSRPPKDILDEIHELVSDGVKEIMLLGQNVNSYAGPVDADSGAETGKSVKNKISSMICAEGMSKTMNFPELLRHVNEIDGLERIRFMTSHPKDFSDELIFAMSDLEKICKHVHLPLQSGSTRVLADMNRQYSKEEYLTLAEKLQAAIPEIALTTDIIVAYPGETEEDFAETLDVVRRVKFASAFTFIYSKRSGTPAAERTDIIPRKTANERFDRLTAALYPIMTAKNEQKIGQIFPVSIESAQKDSAGTFSYKGRTDDHSLVHFSSNEEFLPGETVLVEITNAKTFYLCGGFARTPSNRPSFLERKEAKEL